MKQYFLFQKKKKKIIIQKLDMVIPVSNFNKMWKKPYSIYACQLRNSAVCFWRPQRKLSSLRHDQVYFDYIFCS